MIGEYKLNEMYNEDCLIGLKKIPDKCIDIVVTSPPYDNIRQYNGFVFDFENVAKELYRTLKDGGVIVWVVGDQTINGSESGTSFRQALYFINLGLNLHDTMIYSKGKVIFPDETRYHQSFEYMFVFSKGKPKTINLIKDRKNKCEGSWGKRSFRQTDGTLKQKDKIVLEEYGVRFNIWEIMSGFGNSTRDNEAFEHPAIFPERLANDHIISWSKEEDVVLDPFMGSGTTAKMARINNRNYIGFEISKEYCEIAKKRLSQMSIFDFIGVD